MKITVEVKAALSLVCRFCLLIFILFFLFQICSRERVLKDGEYSGHRVPVTGWRFLLTDWDDDGIPVEFK